MSALLWILVAGNLFFALFVFVLLGKPTLLSGVLASFIGKRDLWQFGLLSTEEQQQLDQLGQKLGQFGLLVLFLWSFLSGILLQTILR